MDPAYKRFLAWFLLATLVGVTCIAAMNVLVDPAGAYPRFHLKLFDPVRYLDLDRVTKAEMARRGDWQIIILGSSRAESGMPAAHPFLTTNRACNLSFAATRFPELVAAFDFARTHNRLEHVILCLDLYMFSKGPGWIQDFAESRFNPGFNRFQYYCKQLLGRAASDRSWQAIRRLIRHYQPEPQETRGFHKHAIGANTSQHELFNRVLRILGAGYLIQTVDPSQLDLFRRLVRTCREQQIDLQIVIMPVHALDLELLYAGGRWPEFETWKRDLVKVLGEEGVEGKFNLWDFTDYAGPPAEPIPPAGDMQSRMKYYFESSHCTPVLGGLMLDSIYGFAGTNQFGVKLDRANVQRHLADIFKDRAEFARTNAADLQWVQRIDADINPKRKRP